MGRYKNPFEDPVEIGIGGLNVSRPPHKIHDTEIAGGYNFWLTPNGEFGTRPGTTAILDSAMSDSIRAIFYYVPGDEIVFVSGTKVYVVNRTGGVPVELGAISSGLDSGEVTGEMFCGYLFIASGGALQYYDGSTLSTLSSGSTYSLDPPSTVSLLAVVKNRMWLGEGSDIFYSGVADYQDWGRDPTSPEGEGALLNGGSFSVQNQDGDSITAFATFQGDLLVFKGVNNNTIHAVLGETSNDFYPKQKSKGLSCVNSMAAGTVDSDVLFCGNGGVYSYRVVDTVGNTQAVPISLKINPELDISDVVSATYAPSIGYFFVIMGNGFTYLYHKPTQTWYKWIFEFSPVDVAEFRDFIYFGASDGQIYRLNDDSKTDNGNEFYSVVRTKVFKGSSPRAINIQRLYAWIKYKSSGILNMTAYGKIGEEKLKSRSNTGEGIDIFAFGSDSAVFGGDGVVFGSSVQTRKLMFKINREADDVQIKFTTKAKIIIMHISLDGAYLSKRGR